jgi:hypothetical protein
MIYNKTIYGIEAIPEPDMTSYRLFYFEPLVGDANCKPCREEQ